MYFTNELDIGANVIQSEYSFGLQQIQRQLNISLQRLTYAEHNFALNTTNLIIQYAESLSLLTSELFKRDGFIADVRNLYRFVTSVRTRLKINIARSIRQFSTQKISRINAKMHHKFIAELTDMLSTHIDRIAMSVDVGYETIECWDSYKAIYFQIGLEATNEISTWMAAEGKRLWSDFKSLKQKISVETGRIMKLLDKQHDSPFIERLRASYYVSFCTNCKSNNFHR